MKAVKFIILAVLLSAPCSLYGQGEGRWLTFHFGAEWGLHTAFVAWNRYAFIVQDGYLVDNKGYTSSRHVNGMICGFVELDLGHRVSVDLRSGYMGISDRQRVVPVTLRTSLAIVREGRDKAGSVFIEGGAGFRKGGDEIYLGRTGYAYRCRLTGNLAVDIGASFLVSYSHPDVYDKYSDKIVSGQDLRQNDSVNAGILLTIALVF